MHSSRTRTIRTSTHLGGGDVCLSACWDTHPLGLGLDTPWAWDWTPPWAWAWTPPGPGHSPWPGHPLGLDTSPLGRPPGPGPGHRPKWAWTWTLPLWTEFLTHACENITFPQLRLRTVMKSETLKQRETSMNFDNLLLDVVDGHLEQFAQTTGQPPNEVGTLMFYIIVFWKSRAHTFFPTNQGLGSIKVNSSNWIAMSVNRSDRQSKSYGSPKNRLTHF